MNTRKQKQLDERIALIKEMAQRIELEIGLFINDDGLSRVEAEVKLANQIGIHTTVLNRFTSHHMGIRSISLFRCVVRFIPDSKRSKYFGKIAKCYDLSPKRRLKIERDLEMGIPREGKVSIRAKNSKLWDEVKSKLNELDNKEGITVRIAQLLLVPFVIVLSGLKKAYSFLVKNPLKALLISISILLLIAGIDVFWAQTNQTIISQEKEKNSIIGNPDSTSITMQRDVKQIPNTKSKQSIANSKKPQKKEKRSLENRSVFRGTKDNILCPHGNPQSLFNDNKQYAVNRYMREVARGGKFIATLKFNDGQTKYSIIQVATGLEHLMKDGVMGGTQLAFSLNRGSMYGAIMPIRNYLVIIPATYMAPLPPLSDCDSGNELPTVDDMEKLANLFPFDPKFIFVGLRSPDKKEIIGNFYIQYCGDKSISGTWSAQLLERR